MWIYLLGALAVFLALIAKTVQGPVGQLAKDNVPTSTAAEMVCIVAEVVIIFVIISHLVWEAAALA